MDPTSIQQRHRLLSLCYVLKRCREQVRGINEAASAYSVACRVVSCRATLHATQTCSTQSAQHTTFLTSHGPVRGTTTGQRGDRYLRGGEMLDGAAAACHKVSPGPQHDELQSRAHASLRVAIEIAFTRCNTRTSPDTRTSKTSVSGLISAGVLAESTGHKA